MNYDESLEFAKLLNTDPSVAFASEYEAAIESVTEADARDFVNSCMESFVDDADFIPDMDDDLDDVTEAVTDSVKNWAGKVADWFKKLVMKFQAFIRGITFKNAQKSFDKKFGGNGKAARDRMDAANSVKLNSEMLVKASADYEIFCGKKFMLSMNDNATADDLAAMTKNVLKDAIALNKKLQSALKTKQSAEDLKDLNDRAKAGGRVIKVCVSVLNAAAKRGVIAKKESINQAHKMLDVDLKG